MNDGQMKELQDQLIEIQKHCKERSHKFKAYPISVTFTRWANCIGTVRVLLDVFRDEWTKSVARGEPGDKSPDKTTGTPEPLNEKDYM